MMLCGYDPKPDGTYDTPPIAPQMWHAYHIAGNQAFIAALGALFAPRQTRSRRYDRRPDPSGGQRLHRGMTSESGCSPAGPCLRQTGRHARPEPRRPRRSTRPRTAATQCVVVNPLRGRRETAGGVPAEQGLGATIWPTTSTRTRPAARDREFNHHFYGQIRPKCIAAFGVEEHVARGPGRWRSPGSPSASPRRTSTTSNGGCARPSARSSIPNWAGASPMSALADAGRGMSLAHRTARAVGGRTQRSDFRRRCSGKSGRAQAACASAAVI